MSRKADPKNTVDLVCTICGCKFRRLRCRVKSKVVFCSPGCQRKAWISPRTNKTHGESRTHLYDRWLGIRNRCTKPNHVAYGYYGGRGILMCDSWKNSYECFRDWAIENGYKEHLEIDRIDVDGDYEPSNCRWVTKLQQSYNRRKRRDAVTSKYIGVSWHSQNKNWKAQICFNKKVMHIGSYDNEIEAAKAYDRKAIEYFGEYANLNFKRGKAGASS